MEILVGGAAVGSRRHGAQFPSDTPVPVFVHGAGMDHSIWEPLLDALASAGQPFLAIDLPGHGGTGGDACGSIEAVADWLADLLTSAEIARAVAVGHSMGAIAVLELAARHPDKVSGIAMLGVAAAMPVHPDLLAMAMANDPAAAGLIGKWAVGRSADWDVVQCVADCIGSAPDGILWADLTLCADYQGGTAAAARVDCPTLLILGSADRMTPPSGADPLISALGSPGKVVLAGAGHMMMLEAPDHTLTALQAFLDEVT